MAHDYKRHGTTSLFAALDFKAGKVIRECHKRHRGIEFRKFLDTIEASVPKNLEIHLILDNYGTQKGRSALWVIGTKPRELAFRVELQLPMR